MSWVLEDSLRVSIDNDPELVSLFTEWSEDHPDIEVISRVASHSVLRAVFHAKHKDAIATALIDLDTLLHRSRS